MHEAKQFPHFVFFVIIELSFYTLAKIHSLQFRLQITVA